MDTNVALYNRHWCRFIQNIRTPPPLSWLSSPSNSVYTCHVHNLAANIHTNTLWGVKCANLSSLHKISRKNPHNHIHNQRATYVIVPSHSLNPAFTYTSALTFTAIWITFFSTFYRTVRCCQSNPIPAEWPKCHDQLYYSTDRWRVYSLLRVAIH